MEVGRGNLNPHSSHLTEMCSCGVLKNIFVFDTSFLKDKSIIHNEILLTQSRIYIPQ